MAGLRVILGPSWPYLGPSRGHLGILEAILAALGPTLGRSCSDLGAILWLSWAASGSYCFSLLSFLPLLLLLCLIRMRMQPSRRLSSRPVQVHSYSFSSLNDEFCAQPSATVDALPVPVHIQVYVKPWKGASWALLGTLRGHLGIFEGP